MKTKPTFNVKQQNAKHSQAKIPNGNVCRTSLM